MSHFANQAGRKLRAWRRSQTPRITQAEAAELLGVSFRTFVRWEQGETRCGNPAVLLKLERMGVCSLEDWTRAVSDSGQAAA